MQTLHPKIKSKIIENLPFCHKYDVILLLFSFSYLFSQCIILKYGKVLFCVGKFM